MQDAMADPAVRAQFEEQKASDHLNLLGVFHFVLGGLGIAGAVFSAFGFFMMDKLMDHPEFKDSFQGAIAQEAQRSGQPIGPEKIEATLNLMDGMMKTVVGIYCVVFAIGSLLTIYSGVQLRRRRGRLFSQIVAGFLCLAIPLGTILGIFTFVVLAGRGATTLYARQSAQLGA